MCCITAVPLTAAPIGFSLGNGGTTLHRFDVNSPGAATTVVLTNSGAPASLDAIDFRPLDGVLYGYDDAGDDYYTIDLATGQISSASGASVTPTGSDKLDIDFNPTIDRMRTVTELDENIVYNPNDGTASNAATNPLFYVAGDPNEGTNPFIVANGYTNSSLGIAATTTQYVLDANLNTVAILANNTGQLTTLFSVMMGGSTLDFSADAGLDIFSAGGGTNVAYALLNVNSVSGLYTIDLSSGETVNLGNFGNQFGTVTGLAIQPTTPVPEPSTFALMSLGAFGMIAFARRRRRSM